MASKLLLRTLMASSVTVAPTLLAAPAHADDSGLVLSGPSEAEVWQYPASQHPHATVLPFRYGTGAGAAPAKNLRIIVDTSGIVDVDVPSWRPSDGDCATEGMKLICTVPGPRAFLAFPKMKLTARPEVPVGTTGSLHITESADGLPTRTADVQVKITEGSPELDLSPLPDGLHDVQTQPGSHVPESLTVTNLGPLPTGRIVVELSLIHGLTLPDSTNCEYARFPEDTPPATEKPDEQDVICTIDQTVRSGESYRLDLGSLGVSEDALEPWMHIAIGTTEDDTAHTWRSRSKLRPGSGSAVTATRTDRPESNWQAVSTTSVKFLANTDTTFKLGATWKPTDGTGLHGTLSVALENPGPGSFVASGQIINFTFPHGSKVVRLPAFCAAGRGGGEMPAVPENVLCSGPEQWLPKGFRQTFDVDVELPDGAQGTPMDLTTWSVLAQAGFPGQNTKTTVVLGDASPSGSPTPTTTASDSSSPALASTGASGSGTIAALGLGAVALGGGVLYLTTRRRRAGAHE